MNRPRGLHWKVCQPDKLCRRLDVPPIYRETPAERGWVQRRSGKLRKSFVSEAAFFRDQKMSAKS
jgi:hypothetical protein